MRCRLILSISEHPIQQGIRICDEDRGIAYSSTWISRVCIFDRHCIVGGYFFGVYARHQAVFLNILATRPVTSSVHCDQSLEQPPIHTLEISDFLAKRAISWERGTKRL